MTILVTGATDKLGAQVVETLLTLVPAEQVAVSVRDPQKAEALRARGVDVRQGDFDDSASLDRAFAGVSRLLIISTDGDSRRACPSWLAARSKRASTLRAAAQRAHI